jgi:hypothetical protein
VSTFLSFSRLQLLVPFLPRSNLTTLNRQRLRGQASLLASCCCCTSVSRRNFLRPSFWTLTAEVDKHTWQSYLNVNGCTECSADSYWRRVNNLRPTTRVNASVAGNAISWDHYMWCGSNVPSNSFTAAWTSYCSVYTTWRLRGTLNVFCNMRNKNIHNENWKIPGARQQFSVRGSISVTAHPRSIGGALYGSY